MALTDPTGGRRTGLRVRRNRGGNGTHSVRTVVHGGTDEKPGTVELAEVDGTVVLFTDYGMSGPPILQLSRKAAYNLGRGEAVTLSVDLMPDRTEEEVIDFWKSTGGPSDTGLLRIPLSGSSTRS